jgi:tRNA(Ile)-lysidine synthase
LCKKKIPLLSKRIGKSLEDTGRLVRYKLLKKLSTKHSGYIVTGHHSQDYLESVLIHLIRGGGASAFNTLPVFSKDCFRPLLLLSQKEISEILIEEKWTIFEDESNFVEKFLRNRVRKNISPLLLKEGLNPDKLYSNFHPEIEIQFSEKPQKQKSYLKIANSTLHEISLENLKVILDAHVRLLNLHPFLRPLLIEIKRRMDNRQVIDLETVEVYLWKSPSSSMYIIPLQSPILKKPTIEFRNDKQFLNWNYLSKEVDKKHTIGTFEKGMKIRRGKISKDVSEVFRELEVPRKVRTTIPILLKDNEPISIMIDWM